MSGFQHIRVNQQGSVLHVTIDRPEVLNALNPAAQFELAEVFDALDEDDRLNIATITGEGDRAFCVGTDLKERARTGRDRIPDTGFAGLTQRFNLNKPVIALVNGDAIGGGLEIVLACDLAIAVATARFGLPEPKVGLVASGGLHRLTRQIPMKAALEVALTAKLFDAETAQGMGLINQVVPRQTFQLEIDKLLDQLMECAPLSLRATKQMMFSGLEASTLKGAYQAKYPLYDRILQSEDAREGNLAFVEKRKPVWRGW